MGCTVEWEGLVGSRDSDGRYWAFSLVNPRAGTTLLRLRCVLGAVGGRPLCLCALGGGRGVKSV